MKRKVLSSIFALALLTTTGYGVDKSMKSDTGLSYLGLTNVEALANGENPGDGIYETYKLINNTFVTTLGGNFFKCTETGIECLGTGTFKCIPEYTLNCERA